MQGHSKSIYALKKPWEFELTKILRLTSKFKSPLLFLLSILKLFIVLIIIWRAKDCDHNKEMNWKNYLNGWNNSDSNFCKIYLSQQILQNELFGTPFWHPFVLSFCHSCNGTLSPTNFLHTLNYFQFFVWVLPYSTSPLSYILFSFPFLTQFNLIY